MVLSRGLVISIGVSALGCTLLFLYFRNKISTVEKKVNLMFDLIQNYEQGPGVPNGQFVGGHQPHHQEQQEHHENDLIEVSDSEEKDEDYQEAGEESEEEDSDEEYDDDSDEVSDNEEDEGNKLSLDNAEVIDLGDAEDIKSININEDHTPPANLDDLQLGEPITDSLDEIDDDDDDDDDVDDDNLNDHANIENLKADLDNSVEEIVNYKKLKVSELKALAKEKGLSNYANLKKQPLIELLLSSE